MRRCRCRGASTSPTRSAALAAAHSLGGPLDVLVAALEQGVRVPGRFEPVEEGQDFAVLVDYAHTPDSLENVLRRRASWRGAGPQAGRVICVFGAGGDRDRGKRPLMGEIAARLADVVVVTSDNPRSEDPEQIIEEIVAGRRRPAGREPWRSIGDRRAAIAARRSSSARARRRGGDRRQGPRAGPGARRRRARCPSTTSTVARELLRRRMSRAGRAR